MAKGIGRLINLGIAKETVRGTAETSATFWLRKIEADLNEKITLVDNEASLGIIEDSTGADIVKKWVEGTINLPVTDKAIGLFLLNLLGTDTPALKGGETVVYDHAFTVAQSAQHQALTFLVEDTLAGQDYKHALGMLSSLEIRYQQGKYIEATAAVRAKKGATATLTSSFTVENQFRPQDVSFKIAATQADLAAASATSLKNLTLKIEQNLEDDDVLGSAEPADILNRQLVITGTCEAIWQDEASFKTAFLAGTQKALRLSITNADVTLGVASNPALVIDLHKVIFKELTRPMKNNDIVRQTLGFKAYYNTTDSKMLTCTLTNLTASY